MLLNWKRLEQKLIPKYGTLQKQKSLSVVS